MPRDNSPNGKWMTSWAQVAQQRLKQEKPPPQMTTFILVPTPLIQPAADENLRTLVKVDNPVDIASDTLIHSENGPTTPLDGSRRATRSRAQWRNGQYTRVNELKACHH